MSAKTFHYTSIAINFLGKILGSKFTVTGIDKLPQHPVMFVANHFTRSETFFVPYLIYKNTGRQVRCLADSGLFHGRLGTFLESVGAISTRNPGRDNIILKDLITGEHDWMIYPEGSMIKSKEIDHEVVFKSHTPHHVGAIKTGSAVLALKSQIYRLDLINSFENHNKEFLQNFEKTLQISYQESLKKIDTYIVPLSITYYPLRPGKNKIQTLATRFLKGIPSQIQEELEIEGNFLSGAEINLSFGDPINLRIYVESVYNSIRQIPIIKSETKTNLILRYLKSRLTNEFMAKIYLDIQINIDHIFGAALMHIKETEIDISRLKRIIYLSATMIKSYGINRINPNLFEENLFKIFLDEPHKEFDDIFKLSKDSGVIEEVGDGKIKINKSALKKRFNFHEIRLKSPLHVIINEFSLLESANNILHRNVKIIDHELRQKVFTEIYKHDLKNFHSDYEIYFDKKFSKEKSVGEPFFLDSKIKSSSRIKKTGIILTHGYKSAPKEVESLAKFLNGFGFKVYAPRLKGHGTAPINIHDTSWEDWYYSLQRGYAALDNVCSKIILVGFSTGGLLSLLSCARKNSTKISEVISINSAMKLLDIKSRMVPGINFWNEMLEKIHVDSGKFEYVDDEPENPHINYGRNYLNGVHELQNLMEICEANLSKISTKALIIQANKDPVVNPVSGKIIYEKIKSKTKLLSEVNFNNHVIINGDRKEEVFALIKNFILDNLQ